MTRTLICAASLFALSLPAAALTQAEVRQCQAMAATFEAKTGAVEAAKAKRDALAEAAEIAGEAWEDTEIHRNISARHAASADAAKKAWDTAKAEFARSEMALQALVRQLNSDMAQFNTKCATDRG